MKKNNGISRGLPWLMAIGLSGLVAAFSLPLDIGTVTAWAAKSREP